ncbi:MAG: universal stress protein [Pseudomonadota bacterium]|nr:universal stress protein [Pseudomonadota bacterium]
MAYKTILVSLNELDRLDTLLGTASALAREHGAHVTGVYVVPSPAVYPAVGPYVIPEVYDGLTRHFEDQRQSVKAKFDGAMAGNGLSSQWLEVRAVAPSISESVGEAARCADLVIASEIDRQGKNGVELDFIENLIVHSGSPILVLPHKGAAAPGFERIICGYDGNKEAGRAIREAVPLLRKANDVRVVWVDPPKQQDAGPAPGADMAEMLVRHGVKATAESMPTGGLNAAEALAVKARELGAGLIVMGAYGHTRLREFVLGGATRYALHHMSVPLFLSH